MNTKPYERVECTINDNLSVILTNVQETSGHDDSFPFVADLSVCENGNVTHVGKVMNDGWGGECEFEPDCETGKEKLDALSVEVGKHRFEFRTALIPITLDMLAESLAIAAVHRYFEKTDIDNIYNKQEL